MKDSQALDWELSGRRRRIRVENLSMKQDKKEFVLYYLICENKICIIIVLYCIVLRVCIITLIINVILIIEVGDVCIIFNIQ